MNETATQQYGLKTGTPALKSIGSLAFGPEGILFVADSLGAKIFAIGLPDAGSAAAAQPINVDNLDTRLAAYLGIGREDVLVRGMAVHPTSQEVYLSVMRGVGESGTPVLVKVAGDGTISDVSLEGVAFAETAITDAPAEDDERLDFRFLQGNREGVFQESRGGKPGRVIKDPFRTITVTDMQYADGELLVAGASNEEFSSTFRRIPFPFNGETRRNTLEIFHVSHGKWETQAPIKTFLMLDGKTDILAGYMCTPVVRFSWDGAQPGEQIKADTVAELGSWNTPIDMVSYTRDGEEYILISNASYETVKIARKDLEQQGALTEPQEPVGVARQSLHKGPGLMANLGDQHILMLEQDDEGHMSLRSHSTASL